MTSSLPTFAICKTVKIFKTTKDIPKKENTVLLYFEKPFKQAVIIFYIIRTLRVYLETIGSKSNARFTLSVLDITPNPVSPSLMSSLG